VTGEGKINTVSECNSASSTILHPLIYLRCVRMSCNVCRTKRV
jgi:hypothetical protein